MRPIEEPPPGFEIKNHRAPSGPAVMELTTAAPGTGYSLMYPSSATEVVAMAAKSNTDNESDFIGDTGTWLRNSINDASSFTFPVYVFHHRTARVLKMLKSGIEP
jgi:hypothetical protein